MEIQENDITVTLGFTEEDISLLMYGVETCTHCGEEIILSLGHCALRCELFNSEHKEWRYYKVEGTPSQKIRHLNNLAKYMINTKIDWTGVDIIELYDEIGTFVGVAEYLGISSSTVSRKYHLEKEPDEPINSF